MGKDVPNSPRANDLSAPLHEQVQAAMVLWLTHG